jgi:UDP-N-acetylmuramate dehydrogenase
MGTLPFDFALENHRLAPLTLYNVGGPARVALAPRSLDEAVAAYDWLRQQPGRKLVLGGGSNVLISDAGFDGIVLLTSGLNRLESLGDDRYRAESGVVLDRLVRDVMLPNNYDGVGGLTGIPGSVGGAIFMNAGTVNGSTCQLLESVEVMTPEGRRDVPMEPSLYAYRGQTFCPRGCLVLCGTFRFARAEADQQAIYDHYLQRRKEKQPQGYCCGSVFKNPPGEHAGRLIESCGLKGTRHGGAIISPMHANFIMNEDGASSEDILWLINLCKRTVRERYGLELEEEVAIIR